MPPIGETDCCWLFVIKYSLYLLCTVCVIGVRVEGRRPVFSSTLMDCSVTEGQDFCLHCSVEGRPEPEVSWLLNGKDLLCVCCLLSVTYLLSSVIVQTVLSS